MNTVVLWLLVSVGTMDSPTQVVERFATMQECSRVQQLISNSDHDRGFRVSTVRCIQATVVR